MDESFSPEDFPAVSKEEWKEKIERDLKSKSWADLKWHLGEEIEIDPFYHPDDFPQLPEPLVEGGVDPGWACGELFSVSDPGRANKQLTRALEGGVEAPLLIFREIPDWQILFEGIHLNMVSLHIEWKGDGSRLPLLARELADFLVERGYGREQIAGSLGHAFKAETMEQQCEWKSEAVELLHPRFPAMQAIDLDMREQHPYKGGAVEELASFLSMANAVFQSVDLPERAVLDSVFVKVAVGKEYFVEIAKLRAMRVLWCNLLQAFQCPVETELPLEVHLARTSMTDNPHQNMIRAGTQAMSAVIGGADRLYIPPADAEKDSPFHRRIARNVQHLLRLEGHVDKVADPAAGSFLVEKLTDRLAEAAWQRFLETENVRG